MFARYGSSFSPEEASTPPRPLSLRPLFFAPHALDFYHLPGLEADAKMAP